MFNSDEGTYGDPSFAPFYEFSGRNDLIWSQGTYV